MPGASNSTFTQSVAAARAGPLDHIFYISTNNTMSFCSIHKSNPGLLVRNSTEIAINGTEKIRPASDTYIAFGAGIGPANNIHLIYTEESPSGAGPKFLAEALFDGINWRWGTLPRFQYGTHPQTTVEVTSSVGTPLSVYYTSPEPQPNIVTAWMDLTTTWQAQQLPP